MKLLTTVKPVTKAKKQELEDQIEAEKQHFRAASQGAIDAIEDLRQEFNLKTVIEDYPVEAAITILLAGFAVARWVGHRRGVVAPPTAPDLP